MFEKNKRLFTAINEITHDKDCSTTCTVLLYVRGMIDVSILIDDLKAEAPPVLPDKPRLIRPWKWRREEPAATPGTQPSCARSD
ncbi:hypothetical protein V1478_001230 [Vespula squamosa]|uniref:Uncharacterized protein n=1 Tax=Vespula squamosa TaxID=30214 RepID=A0ABD2C8K3_VESSQ